MQHLENAQQALEEMDLEDEAMNVKEKEDDYSGVSSVDSFFIAVLCGSLLGLIAIALTFVLH